MLRDDHPTPADRPIRARQRAGRRVGSAFVTAIVLIAGGVATLGGRPAAAQDESVVLEPVGPAPGPEQDPAAVAAQLDQLATSKAMGKQAGTLVVDALSGATLYDDDGDLGLVPASTNKITTAAAVLRTAGPDRTVRTVTTLAGGDLFVVGGGDPLLRSRKPLLEIGQVEYPKGTSFPALAKKTAAALRGQGRTTVDLKVDDTFFTGPNWGQAWPEYYRTQGIAAPVSALLVDDGRIGGSGPIAEDPAMAAGDTFAKLLRKQGITVSSVKRAASPQDAQELAAVTSAPVFELVVEALTWSDNDTAEALFRLAGHFSGNGASFDGGGRAVADTLTDMAISPVLTQFHDGSGLSPDDRIPPHVLVEVLRRVASGQDDLWPIASGLPVAGVTGTLRNRFDDPESHSAAGWVRAKTGTLNFVSTLAGFVQSRSGRILVFATLANESKNTWLSAATIDKIVGRVADCGCPGDARDSLFGSPEGPTN